MPTACDATVLTSRSRGVSSPLSAAPGPARAGDLLATAGEEKSDQIDGVAGEMSRFYESFGFYGHGVSVTTALVPDGWRERLVPLSSPATGAARGWCLEPHDLAVSKFVRGDPKDYRFADALVRAGYLNPGVLVDRLASTRGIDDATRARIARWRRDGSRG